MVSGRRGFPLLWAIAALTGALVLSAPRRGVPAAFLLPASLLATILPAGLWIFDTWAWAWPGVRLLTRRPDLRGTWSGEIHSSWRVPSRGVARAPISAYLVVHQTFSALHLRLLTRESQSVTIAAAIARQPDGILTINAVYHNEPRLSVRDRSPIHLGGLALQLGGPPPTFMTGHYWTDRRSDGEVDFRLMVREYASDYREAESTAAAAEIRAVEGMARRPRAEAAGGAEVRGAAAARRVEDRMSPPSAEQRNRLLDLLCEMLPAQFEILVAKLGVPQQYLSAATQPQATRATEVLRYVDQQGRLEEAFELEREIRK